MNWVSFANPLMLAGILAVGLPVLIHFLTRARPKRVAFPPYRFLVEACAGQQAVHRLRTFLLLAARTLAVLALVLLFARPFLNPRSGVAESESARRVVFLVDASFSMRAAQNGVSLFAAAQSEAADLLRRLDSGTEAAVILAGVKPRPLLPALSRNIPALHDELVKAAPGYDSGDPGAALALAKQLLGGPGTIVVISDFQESNWRGVLELPSGVVCRLRPVSTTPIRNAAVTDIRLVPAEPVVGEPTEIVCNVFNGTEQNRAELVKLEAGGVSQELTVTVPPFGFANAVFNLSFPAAGPFHGSVSIPPDDLSEDNVRHFAGRVSKALRVALITDADARDARHAAFYIERALVPSRRAAPGITIARRHSQDADRGILEMSDVFMLVAPATLTGETIDIVSRRVQEGAQVVVFIDGANAQGLLPAAWNPPFQLARLARSDRGDEVVFAGRGFRRDSELDFAGCRFYRHYETRLGPGRSDEVLLSFSDGSAALSVSSHGRGSVAFVNMPLTPDGGDFLGSPMFPTLLHELLGALRQAGQREPFVPGVGFVMDVPTVGDGKVVVEDHRKQVVPAETLASGRNTRLAIPAPEGLGVYALRQGEQVVSYAAINVDPGESDPRPAAIEGLKAGADSIVSTTRAGQELRIRDRSRPLWPEIAMAAVLLLLVEMGLLALWGRRTGTRPERTTSSVPSKQAVEGVAQ